ncbi:MAG: DedA family protein [Syntrophales bacterium]|nr:DedA family protein [Syntrophales bacterium]
MMLYDDFQIWIASYGYLAIFILLVLGIVGLPVPDETLLVFVGFLVLKGTLHPIAAFACALAGSICGISISYMLGRLGGVFLVHRYGTRFHLSEDRFARVHVWFERVGKWTLIAAYYIPGIRHVIALIAGASELKPSVFCLFAYTGAFLWVTTFMSFGYVWGKEWYLWSGKVHFYIFLAAGIVIFTVAIRFFYQWRHQKR